LLLNLLKPQKHFIAANAGLPPLLLPPQGYRRRAAAAAGLPQLLPPQGCR
jgi:hypothetical protein